MLPPSWLGHYWNPDEGPFDTRILQLRLFVDSSGVSCFEYYYEARSNHGYEIEFHGGTVEQVTGSALVVSIHPRYESAWEDMFKEHRLERDTTPTADRIGIKSANEGKPVLIYRGEELVFKCTDSPMDAALFAKARASCR